MESAAMPHHASPLPLDLVRLRELPLDAAIDSYERLLVDKAEADSLASQLAAQLRLCRPILAIQLNSAGGLGWYRRRGIGYRPSSDLSGFAREMDTPENPL
jgi:hypothetical protein